MNASLPPRPPNRASDGWVVVGTLAVTETVSWGVLFYAFSVFLVPMQAELGWSSAAMTGAFSLALLVSGAAAPFVGRWLDRRGPRALMTGGSVLGALLVLAWSRVEALPVFYAIWVGLGLAMAATLYEPAFAIATAWFDRGRDRAYLLLTVVAGFASTIFLPLSAWLVERLGWRGALVALAAILALLTIPPHALVLRRRPPGFAPDPGGDRPQASTTTATPGSEAASAVSPCEPTPVAAAPSPAPAPASGHPERGSAFAAASTDDAPATGVPRTGIDPADPSAAAGIGARSVDGSPDRRVEATLPAALRDPGFWWLAAAFSLATFASVAIGVHLIPFLVSRGDDPNFAAAVAGSIGAAQVLARVAATLLGGRFSQAAVTAVVFGVQAAALLLLLLWRGLAGIVAAALLLGASRGVVTLMRAGIVAERFGRAHYGAIGGAFAAVLTVARALAPIGAGLAVTFFGGYEPMVVLLAAVAGLSVAAMLPLRSAPPPTPDGEGA